MTEQEATQKALAAARQIKQNNMTRSRAMMGHGDFRTEQVCEDAEILADMVLHLLAGKP